MTGTMILVSVFLTRTAFALTSLERGEHRVEEMIM